MALLDKGLKQRIVGALVLVALAVIFLPMLLSREDETRRLVVDAPSMPEAPAIPKIKVEPVPIPEPLPDEPIPSDPAENTSADTGNSPADAPVITSKVPVTAQTPAATATPPAVKAPSVQSPPQATRLDANSLPVSWSIQLASLSSRASAENLQKTLRGQGYNAYIRSIDGMNRVFVGPVIERAEADRLRDQLNRQQKLNGFIVRFQPESS
ncbi:SPOR domain-containing protein [Pseudomonas sp. LS44]|uniref:SPOR domain-containing protein n=1 Tax=Pseudomonas sp. LS44 TaxID=1357074 RepID=UPI00215A9673|nr:SPOR domain-containing protein [Pseudomonas sp. LS44]UVE19069.1 SPOR domain-containing protein [Pseudomonas sp. LS44]